MSEPPLQPHNREALDAWLRRREAAGQRSSFYPRTVGVLLVATGFALVMHSVTLGLRCLETETWVRTTGMIYSAESRNALGARRGFYTPEVSYAYSAGVRHVGNKLSNADLPVLSEAEVEDLLQDLPAGTVVDVFYDPEQPADAVLITGFPDTLWRIIVPALAFMLVGISMLIRTSGGRG